MVDPNGQSPVFNGATWMSQDGRHFWNGVAWQPVKMKRPLPNFVLIGIAIVFIAGIAWVVHAIPRSVDTTPYGVTNAKIDSSTQIEFDYRAQDSCNNLTFVYTFYNSSGIKVDAFQDEQPSQVTSGKTYHFTISASGQPIDATATRFTATPTCNP
jgi:hypothetical protein